MGTSNAILKVMLTQDPLKRNILRTEREAKPYHVQ